MKERNITITLEKAREWYNSGNATLKEVALQAFSKEELNRFDFTKIRTFEDALTALKYNECSKVFIRNNINDTSMYSRASAAMLKLNIIRKALNLSLDLHLTKDSENSYTYYPYNPFITKNSTYYDSMVKEHYMEKIGKINSEGKEYYVFGNEVSTKVNKGLGNFNQYDQFGNADADMGFLGCATKEIAKHFSKYFGMLITKAKYGDIVDFEIIEKKYEE